MDWEGHSCSWVPWTLVLDPVLIWEIRRVHMDKHE